MCIINDICTTTLNLEFLIRRIETILKLIKKCYRIQVQNQFCLL